MGVFFRKDALSFLTLLFGSYPNLISKYIELRFIREGVVRQEFFKLTNDYSQILQHIEAFSGGYHVFVGIQPREKASGKDEDIRDLVAFWADLDFKSLKNEQEARTLIEQLPIKPTIIIHSGHGYHIYFLLKNSIAITDQNRNQIKAISRAVHQAVKGDSTFNLSRVMRVPGTPNIKSNDPNIVTNDSTKWKFCKIESIAIENKYTLADFETILKIVTPQITPDSELDLTKESTIKNINDLKNLIPSPILMRAKTAPESLKEDRSKNDYAVAIQLYELGLSDSDVVSCFTLFKELGWDCGLKFTEKGSKYLLTHLLPGAKTATKTSKTNTKDLASLLEELERADSADKDELAKPIYRIISSLPPHQQETAIQALQKALNGISIKIIRNELHKLKRRVNGYARFFELTPSGAEIFVPRLLGEYILKAAHYMCLAGVLYRYQDGVFERTGLPKLCQEISENLEYKWSKKRRDEVITWIKDKTYTNPLDLVYDKGFLNLKNGMFNFRERKLYPHNVGYKSITQLPVSYDANAVESCLDQFMEDVFEQDTIPTLWEYCGYSLLNDLELKKFLILIGRGNSGKSSWLSVIQTILGEDNVSNESLHRLVSRPFSLANLLGKTANIYADLESRSLTSTGIIKMLTGGDKLHAEIKHGETFYFKNKAKLFFSANDLPTLERHDRVYFSRLLLVRTPNVFIPGKTADPYILKKLTTENAKSAWLNRALEGVERLIKQQKFTDSKSIRRELNLYRYLSDSVSEFVELQTIPSTEWEEKNVVYDVYVIWCKETGRRPVSMRKFTRRVQEDPHCWEEYHPTGKEGRQIFAWKNVAFSAECRERYYNKDFSIVSEEF